MPFIFNPGAIPGEWDKEGRKEFKKAITLEIKRLGGRPKGTSGLSKLRRLYSELVAKKRAETE